MPDLEQNNQTDFLTEKIKMKPVNRRKLLRRTIITAAMAVIFGLIACFTSLVLEPVISNWLYPEDPAQLVTFPEDREEMSPEDMLAENLPTESPAPAQSAEPAETPDQDGFVLEEEQIQEILDDVKLDLENYKELYSSLNQYVSELSKYMVTVTGVTFNVDWFSDVHESKNQCSGVIISENGLELLILTDYSYIKSAEQVLLTFYDGFETEAVLKQHSEATGLAVLSVGLENLPEKWLAEELPIAQLGASNSKSMTGTPVIAMGSPMGVRNSVGYGILTANGSLLSMADRNYKLLLTDIKGSHSASGVLFNLQGQVIGIITSNHWVSDMEGMITAFGITDLKKIVEKMSNGSKIAYLGIKGVDVTREINLELNVPIGAYVTEIDFDSPAMRAGIQPGDVITGVNEKKITSFNNYSNALMDFEPAQTVSITVMRQVQGEYKETVFHIQLEELKK